MRARFEVDLCWWVIGVRWKVHECHWMPEFDEVHACRRFHLWLQLLCVRFHLIRDYAEHICTEEERLSYLITLGEDG